MADERLVTTHNPDFDLTTLLQASLAHDQDTVDEFEDLFSLSPMSTPASSPPSSPRVHNAQLPPNPQPNRPKDSQPLPNVATADIRKARQREKAHASRRKNREKEREENAQHFGHHETRQAVREKYVENAHVLHTAMNISQASVASTAYVGLDVHGRNIHRFALEELVGQGSHCGFKLVEWDGKVPTSVVDDEDRIYAFLAGHPEGDDWGQLAQDAAAALETRRSRCSVPPKQRKHRRGAFISLRCGVSYGSGQEVPGNLCNNTANAAVLEELNGLKPFKRLAGFASSVFASRAPKLYDHYVEKLGALFASHPGLKRNFTSSVFTAASYNLGPHTVCYKHTDFANLPFGLCAITALGSFDPTKGGHLILWDAHLVIEFPPGSTILIPSAILAHSNVSIGPGETRYSFTQYTAGGLFRWVDNGFKTAAKYQASLTKEQAEADKQKRSTRWAFGLSLFPKIKRSPTPST